MMDVEVRGKKVTVWSSVDADPIIVEIAVLGMAKVRVRTQVVVGAVYVTDEKTYKTGQRP